MTFNIDPIYFALCATLSFSYASTIFTEYSRKIGPLWMNSVKAIIALTAFVFTVILFNLFYLPKPTTLFALILSGSIGLMIGDIFMLKAMAQLGASRMLLIFGLQPFFLGIGGYLFFHQGFTFFHFFGLISMAICLFMISLESKKSVGHWQWNGIFFGLIAIFLDGCGVLLTRFAFESELGIHPLLVNMYRTIGAVIAFVFIYFFRERIDLITPFKRLSLKDRKKVFLGSLLGTFISLLLYLTAISKGKLSVVSAVTITGPMFAAIFECARNKKLPSRYLLISVTFFIIGFYFFYSTRR